MRASDEERERVLAVLRHHYTTGRLSFEELSIRLGGALKARTFGELYSITEDLPHVAGPHPILDRGPALPRRGRRRPGAGGRPRLGGAGLVTALALVLVVAAGAGPASLWALWPVAGLLLGIALATAVVRRHGA
jgi:hypothetical protein